jgi:hypothetical protein
MCTFRPTGTDKNVSLAAGEQGETSKSPNTEMLFQLSD